MSFQKVSSVIFLELTSSISRDSPEALRADTAFNDQIRFRLSLIKAQVRRRLHALVLTPGYIDLRGVAQFVSMPKVRPMLSRVASLFNRTEYVRDCIVPRL